MRPLRRRRPGSRPVLLPAALAILLAAPFAAGPAHALGTYRVPRPVAKKLANGLQVLVFPDARQPVVTVELRVPAGVVDEPREQDGVASLTADMLGRGTISHSAESFTRDLAQLGARFSASAGREYATVASAFLSRDLDGGLELVADAVTHPVLLEEEFRRAANAVGRRVLQLHQNPPATAIEQLWTLTLPESPAARPQLGRLETLGRLSLDQVRAFYRERYRPGGTVLAIAGDVTPERAFAAAEEWFGSWPAGEARPAPTLPRRPRETGRVRIRIVDQPGSATAALAVGFAVPGRGSADALARSVAARLFERQIAERLPRGAVRDVRSALELTRDHGLWTVQAAAPADSAAVLAQRITSELKRFLFAPPALQEVSAEQHRIRRGFPLAFETADGLVSQWLLADFAGFPADYFDAYGARVGALTPQELQSAARREADSERPFIVAVGPAGRIRPLLEAIGPVEIMTIDRLPEAVAAADTLGAHSAEQEAAGRKLISQSLAAHGGRSRLAVVKSSVVDAAIRFQVPGSEVSGTMRQIRKEPDKLALVTSVRGVDTRQVLNGDRTWTVIAESDTALEGDSLAVESLRATFGSDLLHVLLSASDKNARVAARGSDRVNGRDAEKVEVVSGRDPWRMLYFEATSHRLMGFDQRERGPRGPYTSRVVYADYRPLDGIQWPYQEERFVGGQPLMKLSMTGVEINIDLNEKQFQPPTTVVKPGR
jgi:zinc protease